LNTPEKAGKKMPMTGPKSTMLLNPFIALFVLHLSIFIFPTAKASFSEQFGVNPSTACISGQVNGNAEDPANAYYAAAINAFSDRLSVNISYNYVDHKFEPIQGVVIRNSSNNNNGTAFGDVNTSYGELRHFTLSGLLPIRYPGAGNLVLNISSPIGNFLETNTGHPTLPEYVFYRSRYKRTEFNLNYAHPFSDSFSISLGAFVGFQVRADLTAQASLNGSSFGSSASSKAKVSPALGALASMSYRLDQWTTYFSYQQEMKSNLDANITGETSDPPIPFDIAVESLPYYDPHIFRVGTVRKGETVSVMAAVEYQMWENFRPPNVRIIQRASVKSSDNFERLQTRNIFVPKVGASFAFNDHLALSAGVGHRPTPIEGNFSGAGNTIDSDSMIYSTGFKYTTKMLGFDVDFLGALQWHQLEEKTVTKTTGQENGQAGTKIGGPYYKIGGDVYYASLGAKFLF